MPSYLVSSVLQLLLLAGSGAFAFLLIQDKATLSSYLPMAGAGLGLLALILTFVRRRQCTLARDTSNQFRASPLVTLFLRLTALLLLVYTAASVYLALLMFGVFPVPGFLGPPGAVVGESAVSTSSMQGMRSAASPSATAGQQSSATARRLPSTRTTSLRVPTVTPAGGARQQRVSVVSPARPTPRLIVSRTVPNVPIVLSSPTPRRLARRQAPAPATRTPAPRSNGAAATPIRIANATPAPATTSTARTAAGGQLSTMTAGASPKLVVKILAMAQGALGLLAMGALVALPVPLERVGTDALPPLAAMNNAAPTAGKPTFQPGLGDAADGTMYSTSTGTRSLDTKSTPRTSPRVQQSPRMAQDSVASFHNQGAYSAGPPPQAAYGGDGYYAPPPPPPVDPGYYQDPAGYYDPGSGPPPGAQDFPRGPAYADTLPMTAAAGFRSPPPQPPPPQFTDNPAYMSPPAPQRAYPSPPQPTRYASPGLRSPAAPTARRPSQDSRGTFASNRLYQDGPGGGAAATPSTGPRSAGVPSVGGPGDYASDTLRSGFSLRNVNPATVPGMQERGVGRPLRGGVGVERMRVEPKRAVAKTMYLSDDD